jgi:hypothetical protein
MTAVYFKEFRRQLLKQLYDKLTDDITELVDWRTVENCLQHDFIQPLLDVFEDRETIDRYPEDTSTFERIALLLHCKSVHELEMKVVRKCIACETNPCTIRFGCGHSCFCPYCFGLFVTTPREVALNFPCPCCRRPIIRNEIQEDDSVAVEAEYIEPVVHAMQGGHEFSEVRPHYPTSPHPLSILHSRPPPTYTHVYQGPNHPTGEDYENIFGP